MLSDSVVDAVLRSLVLFKVYLCYKDLFTVSDHGSESRLFQSIMEKQTKEKNLGAFVGVRENQEEEMRNKQ